MKNLSLPSNKSTNREYAFTLAEVLITLGIIGVVASLTIPVVTKNIQDMEYKQAWKKEYSALNQAFSRVLQDYGGSVKGYPVDGSNFSRDAFSQYLKVVKKCNIGSVECWSNNDPTLATNDTKLLGGGNVFLSWGPLGSGVVLLDGAFILFRDDSPACDISGSAWGMGTWQTCSQIWVDTNGKKSPNTVGKDIFLMFMTENRLVPAGASGTAITPSKTCTNITNPAGTTALPRSNTLNTGYGCAAAYLGQ